MNTIKQDMVTAANQDIIEKEGALDASPAALDSNNNDASSQVSPMENNGVGYANKSGEALSYPVFKNNAVIIANAVELISSVITEISGNELSVSAGSEKISKNTLQSLITQHLCKHIYKSLDKDKVAKGV